MASYLSMPGIAANTASTPDAAALDIVGDTDVRMLISIPDLTPAQNANLMSKWSIGGGGQRSWVWGLNTIGRLSVYLSANGIATNQSFSSVGIQTVFSGGDTFGIRWVYDVSETDMLFYTSPDFVTWTQLGIASNNTQASIFSSSAQVVVGNTQSGTVFTNPFLGNIYRTQIYDGIAGTLVFDSNFTLEAPGTTSFAESSAQAATVTINQASDPQAEIVADSKLPLIQIAHEYNRSVT